MVKFNVGELVVISKPYAYVLDDDLRGRRCDYCFKKQDHLKRCSQCSFVCYCNKDCQVKGWIAHVTECKLLSKAISKPDKNVRLIGLVISKVKKYGKDEPSETVHGREVTFGSLMSHAEEIKQNREAYEVVKVLMESVRDFIGKDKIPPLEEFIEIYGKLTVNQFGIYDDNQMRDIGAGLYLGASVFDHSCEPNAETIFDGISICIRAKKYIPNRDISKVRISYIEQLQLSKDRQDSLMSRYYFRCQCSRCSSSEFDNMMTKTHREDAANDSVFRIYRKIKFFEDLKQSQDVETSPLYEKCVEELMTLTQDESLADTHICKVKAWKVAYEQCMKNGQLSEALAFGTKLTKAYRLYYGDFHPTLGIHLFEIANLQGNEGRFAASIANLQEAKKIIKVTHGEGHPLYQRLFA